MQSLGSALLPEYYRRSLVLPAAQTHILLHDVLSVFNRPGAALFHARAATTLLKLYTPDGFAGSVLRYEVFEPRLEPANEERHEGMIDHGDLLVNAVRSEVVSLNMLRLFPAARALSKELLENQVVKQRLEYWLPHILRDMLSALAQDVRVPLSDVEAYARWASAVCEKNDDNIGGYLIHNQLARGYIYRERYGEAEGILHNERRRVYATPGMGQIHKGLLLANLTDLYAGMGDWIRWAVTLRETLLIAYESGLSQISWRISQDHGARKGYSDIRHESMEMANIAS